MSLPIPEAALRDHMASLGKTLPAYKRDQRKILCLRNCGQCGDEFPVAKKFPDARFCSRRCGLKATLPEDHNARISRESAYRRGDAMRGRGKGKSYPKMYGKHAHRRVAEQELGRQLMPGEIVHHKDENKLNYQAENLEVLASQSEHAKLHHFGMKGGK